MHCPNSKPQVAPPPVLGLPTDCRFPELNRTLLARQLAQDEYLKAVARVMMSDEQLAAFYFDEIAPRTSIFLAAKEGVP